MTTSKFASRSNTKTDAPKARRTKPAAAAREAVGDTDAHTHWAERVAQANDDLLASYNTPTKVRIAVAAITRLLAFSVSLYWGLEAAAIVMTAAIVFTTSGFIAWVAGFMAMVLAFYASWTTAAAIGDAVLNFNVTSARELGRDLRIAAAKRVSLVKGWFRKPEVELELEPRSA